MDRNFVLSLYDFTGTAVRPWAELGGYDCICFDKQHPTTDRVERFPSGGSITYRHADLHSTNTLLRIHAEFFGRVVFMFAFPVCTDLATSGAKHFARKERERPGFQHEAARHARLCGQLGDLLGCPWMVENPRSVLSTLWRKPNHRFDPCDFGGWLPEDDAHPYWPDHIPARDAYTKGTYLWTGGGFTMPNRLPVDPVTVSFTRADGRTVTGSPQWGKLGGKSAKTKNIRSATPRGFAMACFIANDPELNTERAAA